MVRKLVFSSLPTHAKQSEKSNDEKISKPIATLYYALREEDGETIMGIRHIDLVSTEDNLNEYLNALDKSGSKVSAHYSFHNNFPYYSTRQRPLLNDDFEPIENTSIVWKSRSLIEDKKNNLSSFWEEDCLIVDQDGDKIAFGTYWKSGNNVDDFTITKATGKYEKAKKVVITYDNDGTILVKKNMFGQVIKSRKTSRKVEIF